MTPMNSLLLCVVYALFLVLGGVIFRYMEYDMGETIEIYEPPEWTRLKDLALMNDPPADEDQLLSLAPWLPRACPALSASTVQALVTRGSQAEAVRQVEAACPHLHQENVTEQVIYRLTFFDALFFSMTITTTIGYGHISPVAPWSKVVTILYALIGVPLTGILLAWTSDFFGTKLLHLFKSKLSDEKQHSHRFIAAATFIYFGLGLVVFIFIPAAVFVSLEVYWNYLDAVYFCFITLSTIGFGDLVPGYEQEGVSRHLYQVCVIAWVMVSLGYWVMVANFIAKALKSKRLKTSMKRSAEEMKKLMQQLGLKNHDPVFLRQHSKATLNLMLQLSSVLAVQDPERGNASDSMGDSGDTATTGPSSPSSPNMPFPGGIPGIANLMGGGLLGTPLSNLAGPLKKEDHAAV